MRERERVTGEEREREGRKEGKEIDSFRGENKRGSERGEKRERQFERGGDKSNCREVL